MLWFSLGVLAVLLAYAFVRARAVAPLFTDDHVLELGTRLAELKRAALEAKHGVPAATTTSQLSVAYTIDRDGAAFRHHVSVSSPATPARAAGTFFLGLLRGALGLGRAPFEAFVTRGQVFHLVATLSQPEHEALVAKDVPVADAEALRSLAIAGRAVVMPLLRERGE